MKLARLKLYKLVASLLKFAWQYRLGSLAVCALLLGCLTFAYFYNTYKSNDVSPSAVTATGTNQKAGVNGLGNKQPGVSELNSNSGTQTAASSKTQTNTAPVPKSNSPVPANNLDFRLSTTEITINKGSRSERIVLSSLDNSPLDWHINTNDNLVITVDQFPLKRHDVPKFEFYIMAASQDTQPGIYTFEVRASKRVGMSLIMGSKMIKVTVMPQPTFDLVLSDGEWEVSDSGQVTIPFTVTRKYGHNLNMGSNTSLVYEEYVPGIETGSMFLGKGSAGSNTITIGPETPPGVYIFQTCVADEIQFESCAEYSIEVN